MPDLGLSRRPGQSCKIRFFRQYSIANLPHGEYAYGRVIQSISPNQHNDDMVQRQGHSDTVGQKFHVNKNVSFRKLEGEHILLDLDSGNFFSLNKTGSEIWDRLAQGMESEKIINRIVESFDVPRERAGSDFRHLCTKLREHGLIRVERENQESSGDGS